MQKLLKIGLIFLIVSSCQTDMPRFKIHLFCQIYFDESLTEKLPKKLRFEVISQIKSGDAVCLCARYDLNIADKTEEYKQHNIRQCHGLMGTSVENWYEEVEPTIKEIQQWDFSENDDLFCY